MTLLMNTWLFIRKPFPGLCPSPVALEISLKDKRSKACRQGELPCNFIISWIFAICFYLCTQGIHKNNFPY